MTTATTQTDDLSQPLYGATFGQAISRFFKKYATFTGRASRSEFWWWYLAQVIVAVAISLIGVLAGYATIDASGALTLGPGYWIAQILAGIWFLATIVPWLALSWRRLHDADKPGPFYFLGLIPFVGWIIMIVLFVLPSDPAGVRFDR